MKGGERTKSPGRIHALKSLLRGQSFHKAPPPTLLDTHNFPQRWVLGVGDEALHDLLRCALMPAPTFPKARKTGLSSSSSARAEATVCAASEPGASSPVARHFPPQCCLGLQGGDRSGLGPSRCNLPAAARALTLGPIVNHRLCCLQILCPQGVCSV